MTNFQQSLRHFVNFLNEDIKRLTKRDYCRLMARYLQEIYKQSPQQAMNFITQLKQCKKLPLLLADFLEGRRNGPYAFSAPEFTLADTLAQDTLQSGESVIEEACDEEVVQKICGSYKYNRPLRKNNHVSD